MDYPIDPVLEIVRTHEDPGVGWQQIVDACRGVAPDAPWDRLPTPDIERDIHEASAWVDRELGPERGPCGIYLGLDTLNMRDGANAAFGKASGDHTKFSSADWVFELSLVLGGEHLIRGLYELHRAYSKRRFRRVFSLCDYTLFLGYSGLVFAQVFERQQRPGQLFPTWGFHDGDLFLLGRYCDGAFARVCEC